jgi:hypothetical protein
MKIGTAHVAKAESPARVEFQVRFSAGPKGKRRVHEAPADESLSPGARLAPTPTIVAPAGRIPKMTRLLVLGHHLERLVRDGVVKDYAQIAHLTGLTRARVTQIVNLTLLAPGIQEAILNLSRSRIAERNLRPVAALVDWKQQCEKWHSLVPGAGVPAVASPRSVHPR